MKLKFANALSLALIMAMLFTSIGLADQVVNNIDLTIDSNPEVKTITVGGSAVVGFFVQPSNTIPSGDASGCNATGSAPATVNLSIPANVTASVSALTFSGCGIVQNVTFSSSVANLSGYIISVSSVTGGKSGSGWDTSTADFKLIVNPPANTAPNVSVTGVSNGATYSKGSVPAAGCSVIDAEDGNSTSAATLSTITGTYASDGIGSQTASCSYTDAGGITASASATYSIIDPSAPSISYVVNAVSPDGNNGWYKSNVTLTWTVSDSESPNSLLKTGCVDQNITADQPATSYSCSASSAGGSAGPVSVTIRRDATAPVITFDGPSTSSWYNTDVTANWSCTDALSGPVDASVSATTTGEGSAVLATGTCTDNAGNIASNTQSFMVDQTGPSITASATKADTTAYAADTWTNQNVTVHFACSDGGSGVASCSSDAVYNTEGTFTASGSATDNAGNSSNTSFGSIKIDKTPPTITGAPTTLPNSNGWYNGDVAIHWTCSDALSGLAGSCPADSVITGEGDDLSVSALVSDTAGNSASATVSGIKIDRTAPTASASASPAANSNGWNNTDVTVSFSGSDALSGIDFCDAAVVLSSDGADQSASGTCTDMAGNVSALATASNIDIDKTNPTVSLVGGPANGGTYYFGFVPAAPTCSASDSLSGLDGSCPVSGYSNAAGSHTVTASATDKAGNSASASASYTVNLWSLSGFYQPVDMGNILNTVKNGSTVPLKFKISAGTTELTDIVNVNSVTAVQYTCTAGVPEDAIETLALNTGGSALRYDTTAGQFIFNWKTPSGSSVVGKCYRVTMESLDGSKLIAYFKLK